MTPPRWPNGMTFPEVATELKLWERVCMDPLSRCNILAMEQHKRGFVRDGVIHYRNRQMTRRGLWNFLKLVGRLMADARSDVIWTGERVWFEDEAAYDLGLSVGVRFPRSYADTDRAQVRAALAASPGAFGESRTKMERWAYEAPG